MALVFAYIHGGTGTQADLEARLHVPRVGPNASMRDFRRREAWRSTSIPWRRASIPWRT